MEQDEERILKNYLKDVSVLSGCRRIPEDIGPCPNRVKLQQERVASEGKNEEVQ